MSLVCALLAGCAPKPNRAPCPSGKVCLELGNGADPGSLDPNKIAGTWEDRVVGDLMVGLTQSDAAGNTIPGVATSWTTSADGKTWTFHLRDAKWSDGVPVTAGDFVFALRRLLDPKTGAEYAYLMYVIQNGEAVNDGKLPPSALGVRALDPRTLEITLTHPAPYLPELTKHMTMYPLPRHVVERWGDAWSKPEHYVSDGPYELVSWRLGDRIELVKNPLFWDAASVCADVVRYYPIVDSVAAEHRVRSGELDANGAIQANRVPFLRRVIPRYVRVHTYLGVNYLTFNTHDATPFRDRRVRLALDMAVDRDFITKKLLFGLAPSAYTFVPPATANYVSPARPVWSTWPLARRQAAARVLLAEAGYGPAHPLRVELKHFDSPGSMLVAPSIQADWRAIGVTTTLVQEEAQIAYEDFRLRNFEVATAGWIADYDDATNFLDLNKSSTGPQNYGDYHNPTYDALLDAADNEPDLKKRARLLSRAEAIMLADAPVAPVDFAVSTNLVSPKLTGWVDNLTDIHRSRYLCLKGR